MLTHFGTLFAMGRPYRFCYACAPVKLFHVEHCAPLHKINCFTWNTHQVLTKVKTKIIYALMLVC